MKFKNVEINDKRLIESFLLPKRFMGCEYSFVNMIIWHDIFRVQFAVCEDVLYLRSRLPRGDVYYLPVPKESKCVCDSIDFLKKYVGDKLSLAGISGNNTDFYINCCLQGFNIESRRDIFDYIYLTEELATLSGKKHQQKRNHINKFISLYGEPLFENITKDNLNEVFEFDKKWRRSKQTANDIEKNTDDSEEIAVRKALENFFTLGLNGGLLRVNGNVIAYTAGSELSPEMFDIHIEKASTDYHGAYTVINYLFAKTLLAYKYINREDDLGIDGLRKAKLSYHPHILLEKFIAVQGADNN